jgi:hypothetical protein
MFSAEGGALAYRSDGRWLAVRAADEKTALLLDAQMHETAMPESEMKKVVSGGPVRAVAFPQTDAGLPDTTFFISDP